MRPLATAVLLSALTAACGVDAGPTIDDTAASDSGPSSPDAPSRRVRPRGAAAAEPKREARDLPTTAAGWNARLRADGASDEERVEARDAMVKLGADSVPFLVEALDDLPVSAYAMAALGRLGPAAVAAAPALLDRLRTGEFGTEVPVLANMGPGVVPLLAKALEDGPPEVRGGAANALMLLACKAVQSKDADTASRIADLLAVRARDADPRVRQMSVEAVGVLWNSRGDSAAILLAALADADGSVRRQATNALGRCPGDASAATAGLVRALDDPDYYVALGAAEAIRALGDRAGDARLRVLEFVRKNENPRGAGDIGVDTLRKGLASDDPEIRRIAASSLAGLGPKARGATASLVAAVDDPSPDVRVAALDALTVLGPGTEAIPRLRAALESSDARVRAAAARALGVVPAAGDDVVRDLVATLTDASPDVRRAAAASLGRVAADPGACVKPLVALLAGAEPSVRSAAASALGSFGVGAADAVPDLRPLLADADPRVRVASATSLARIVPAASEPWDAFRRLVEDAAVDVRRETVRALGGLGTPDAVALLVGRLDDRARDVRLEATKALAGLGAAASAAAAKLETMTKSRDRGVADEARAALARIGGAK